ncbi:ParA family protein [Kitasatospora paracochleata]|uniref:Chromosome partitioning protein n=1 Tax=Kitasatospora paracochleata TaxID=58354 RepID=A0ABT1JA98_9ACTN|nr:ParA family protein [Kitasatospora paracochleata]MCP2314134.1 chromosome partitioning protein [Kitasatospora paracochleata]
MADDQQAAEALSDEEQGGDLLDRPMTVISIASQKGGIGKTVTTVNVAARLAMAGFDVAIVDLDPQAQAGEAIGVELKGERILRSLGLTFQHALQGIPIQRLTDIMFDQSHILNEFDGAGSLFLIASEESTMTAAQNALITQPYTTTPILRRMLLEHLRGVVDFVIIDTPPSMSSLNAIAYAASDYVITVLNPQRQTVKGALVIKPTVEKVGELTLGECTPQFLGVLLNDSNSESKWTAQDVFVINGMVSTGLKPFKTDIRSDVRISDCFGPAGPVVVQFPNHAPGKRYTALVEEILRRIDTPSDEWEIASAASLEEVDA